MKKLLLSIISLLVLGLLVTSSGFAYPTWTNGTQGGCNNCHPTTPGTGVHTLDGTAHQTCSNCHPGGNTSIPPVPSACIVCHPQGNTGLCPLINASTAGASHGATCLTSQCHGPTCAPSNTTTTTPSGTTTTTSVSGTTTTTTTEGACITINPAEVTVNGIDDVTTDVKVTINRSGLGNLTPADLEKLEVSLSAACSPYVTVNAVTYAISDDTAQGTVNITVKGTAPSTECTLNISDPTGIVNPPLNCEATFTITSTAEGCKVLSIKPSGIRVGIGLVPRIRKVAVTLNVNLEEAGITPEDLNFENAPKGVTILSAQITGSSIEALILFWGVTPGTYNVNVGPCGSIPFTISRF